MNCWISTDNFLQVKTLCGFSNKATKSPKSSRGRDEIVDSIQMHQWAGFTQCTEYLVLEDTDNSVDVRSKVKATTKTWKQLDGSLTFSFLGVSHGE